MAITYLNQYTLQAGTTSLAMTPPASTAAGDLDIVYCVTKLSSITPTISAGFTSIGSAVVGTGADGEGTGPVRLTAWYRILTAAATASTITITGGNCATGGGMIYRKAAGENWRLPTMLSGSDTSSGTAFSASMSAQAGYTVGDWLLSIGALSLNTSLSARGITVPGCTTTVTGINSGGTSTGNDCFLWTDHANVTAGSQTGVGVTTGTTALATTGGAVQIRVSLGITFQSISTAVGGTTSAALTWPASIAANDLQLAHSTSKPFGSVPTWATVCPMASVADGTVASGTDVGSVIATSAARVATGALTGTETMTVAAGTVALGSISRWSIAAGKVWSLQASQGADTTITLTAVSATGTALSVQPGDVIVVTVAITSDTINHTAQAVTLAGATLSAVTWQAKMLTTLGAQASMYVGYCQVLAGTVTAAPVYAATSSLSGQSGAAVTFLRLREQSPQLPGLPIGLYGDPMVEPESHSHCPPVVDGNGNIYRFGESNLAHDTNRLLVQKSVDGGITFQAVAWASHPTAQDLEAAWVRKVGTKVYVMVHRDNVTWMNPFNLSDDASPDTYGTQEQIDTYAGDPSQYQYCSFTVRADGTMPIFYSAEPTPTTLENQIAWRIRTAANTYTAKAIFADGVNVNVTGPAAVLGASDVTYVFYHDKTANTLYYRTVSAAGVLSAKTAVASGAALSAQSAPHTNPIYYNDAGVEVIAIAYADDAGLLRYRELRGGVLQTEQTISTAAITQNPGATTSESAVAHLAVDGTTVYAMWSRAADGDLMMNSRVAGTWGTEQAIWVSAGQTGWYVYCDVAQVGTNVKLIYTYDQGTHVDDASNITYNELLLRTITAGTPVTAATETDAAQLVARSKVKPAGATIETEQPQPAGRRKVKALGVATEADTAPPVLRAAGPRVAGVAAETEQPQPVGRRKIKAVGVATETEQPQPLGRRKAPTVAAAIETEQPQPAGRRKIRAVGVATETDTPQIVARRKVRAVGVTTETEQPVQIVRLVPALGIVTETDTPQPIVRRKIKAVGVATETEQPIPVGRRRGRTLGAATETDAPQIVARRKVRTAGVTTETELARVIAAPAAFRVAAEIDTAPPLGRRKVKALTAATETDTGQLLRRVHVRQLGALAEIELARPFGRIKIQRVTVAGQTDQATPILNLPRYVPAGQPTARVRGVASSATVRGGSSAGIRRGSVSTGKARPS